MPITPNVGKQRAVQEATLLKRAWVVASAWIGHLPSSRATVEIPDYENMRRGAVETEVRALREDLGHYLDHILGKPRTNALNIRATKFLAAKYESLIQADRAFSLCDVQEFISRVGRLPEAVALDAPPYTEILMQGFRGMAYRHPEYMLARIVPHGVVYES